MDIHVKITLIPYWIQNALSRNSMQIQDVFDYNKLRKVLSFDDALDIYFLNKHSQFLVSGLLDNGDLFNRWRNTCSQEYITEVGSVMSNLSCNDEKLKDIIARLNQDDDDIESNNPKKQLYQLIDLDRENSILVLNPGYVKNEHTPVAYYKILTDLLQLLYMYNKIQDVSRTKLFYKYLMYLQKQKT
jgi:hypothetical protein